MTVGDTLGRGRPLPDAVRSIRDSWRRYFLSRRTITRQRKQIEAGDTALETCILKLTWPQPVMVQTRDDDRPLLVFIGDGTKVLSIDRFEYRPMQPASAAKQIPETLPAVHGNGNGHGKRKT